MTTTTDNTPTSSTPQGSAVVRALEDAWAAIRREHPDVPAAVIVTGAGSGRVRNGLVLGHYGASRWRASEDRNLPEIFIAGEGLERPAAEVFATALHEAAHALAAARRIAETSREGRYHNKRFMALAQELGLDVAQQGARGWAATTIRPETVKLYAAEIDQLQEALTVYRAGEGGGRKKPRARNGVSCECGCGRKIRVAESVFAIGPISCGVCGEDFAEVAAE